MLSKYFQQFLEDNDLQINERFTITDADGNPQYINRKFWINKQNGGKLVCDDKKIPANEVMLSLLRNKMFTKKRPWEPQDDDIYYYVTAKKTIDKTIFCDNCTLDRILRKAGKCYRTYEEAKLHYDQDCNDLLGDEQ